MEDKFCIGNIYKCTSYGGCYTGYSDFFKHQGLDIKDYKYQEGRLIPVDEEYELIHIGKTRFSKSTVGIFRCVKSKDDYIFSITFDGVFCTYMELVRTKNKLLVDMVI